MKKRQLAPLIILCFLFIGQFFFTSCEKTVSATDPQLPPPFNGKLIFDSNPRGAKIIVNGSNIGKVTPDSMLHMEPGSYHIRFCFDPYLDLTDSVNLTDEEPGTVFASFMGDERNFGYIECLSEPEHALIFLNDSCTNQYTPDTLKFIWPGTYEVRYTYPEHRSGARTIVMSASHKRQVNIRLQDTSLCVDYYDDNSDFPDSRVNCILIDENNVKWAGTHSKGIVKFTETTVTRFSPDNSSLINGHITSLVIDNQGRKWAGTRYGLAMINENEILQLFTTENSGLLENYITALSFDNDGNLWIGAGNPSTERFLVKYDGANWTSYPSERFILALTCDHSNRMWVGLDRGFLIFENEEWYSLIEDLEPNHKLKNHPVESLLTDFDGRVWVGAAPQEFGGPLIPGRLFVYSGNELLYYSFPSSWVSGIYQAANGSKWVTLYGAHTAIPWGWSIPVLIEIEPDDTFRIFRYSESGLPTPHLICSATDNAGNLWIGADERGLIKLKNVTN